MAKKNRLLLCQSSAVGNLSILYNLLFYVTSLLLKKENPIELACLGFFIFKRQSIGMTILQDAI